jgi:hypothetical protein
LIGKVLQFIGYNRQTSYGGQAAISSGKKTYPQSRIPPYFPAMIERWSITEIESP